ncbi:hypothetical protein ACVBEG_27145 [Pseudomonas sp. GG8]
MIREQFPVALIDQLQDTDPVQVPISSASTTRGARDRAVPDRRPRAAISRSVALTPAYLRARSTGPLGTGTTLDQDHHAIVEAIEIMLERAERRAGRGAFLFMTALTIMRRCCQIPRARTVSGQWSCPRRAECGSWKVISRSPVRPIGAGTLAASCASEDGGLNEGQQGLAGL